MANRRDDYTIIVGCGRLGANLANTLSDEGGGVLIIDARADAFRKLAHSYGGLSIVGDATQLHVLHEAEIERATAVVTVTNNDNTNILVAQLAREMFHIPHVIARLYDPSGSVSTTSSALTPSAPRCSPRRRSTSYYT